MIVNEVPNFPSFFLQIFCLKFQPVYKPYSFWACAARAHRVHFRQKLNHQVAFEFWFPKMYYLIAFYHYIVELWCHAKNFPNAPHIFFCCWSNWEFFCLELGKKTIFGIGNGAKFLTQNRVNKGPGGCCLLGDFVPINGTVHTSYVDKEQNYLCLPF